MRKMQSSRERAGVDKPGRCASTGPSINPMMTFSLRSAMAISRGSMPCFRGSMALAVEVVTCVSRNRPHYNRARAVVKFDSSKFA